MILLPSRATRSASQSGQAEGSGKGLYINLPEAADKKWIFNRRKPCSFKPASVRHIKHNYSL
ncbi:hypothetical protein PSCICM_10830 [Pseudomonas cichorii]|nr:hypothetical protein PSCICM_10830 [Pseudomonas cichorii]